MIAVPQSRIAAALREPGHPVPPGFVAMTDAERRRRFAVHRNTYVAGLIENVAAAFPVAREMVGDACFDAMLRERLRVDPPASPVLTEYARSLPAFAADWPAFDAVPYVRDVLVVEALRIDAYHAADAAPLEREAWQHAARDPDAFAAATVTLHPAACWCRLRHAAVDLWHAHQAPDTRDAALATIDPGHAQDVLVTRPHLDVEVRALVPGALDMLDALAGGAPLGVALHPTGDAAALLALLIDAGLVHRLDLPECPA